VNKIFKFYKTALNYRTCRSSC